MKINDIYDPSHYLAASNRYDGMKYRRCGQSGIFLPMISLGLWHNFGHTDELEKGRNILRYAFDNGITHFDLANNYGPPFGAAEENFGRIFKRDFRPYRDELFIATKAGWDMWPWALWQFRVEKIPPCFPRPKFKTNGLGLCGRLLSPPPRPQHPIGGDNGRIAPHCSAWQGPLCRYFSI